MAVGAQGLGKPHDDRQRVLALNYSICPDSDPPSRD